MRLVEKWWQCVTQMEVGEPVASGPSDQRGTRNVLLQIFGAIPLNGLLCGAVVGRGHSFSRVSSWGNTFRFYKLWHIYNNRSSVMASLLCWKCWSCLLIDTFLKINKIWGELFSCILGIGKEKVVENVGLHIKHLVCPRYCKWHLLSNPGLVSSSAHERGNPQVFQALLTWLSAKGWHELGKNGTEYQAAISKHS